MKILYDPITKTFSPSWDKKKYERNLKGYTDEFCHNLLRLMMRPNSESAHHWFHESINWLNDALGIRITVENKPVLYLFSFFSDSKKISEFNLGTNFDFLYTKVRREITYGSITNSDIDYLRSKTMELINSIDPKKIYSEEQVIELYSNWFNSIEGNNNPFEMK